MLFEIVYVLLQSFRAPHPGRLVMITPITLTLGLQLSSVWCSQLSPVLCSTLDLFCSRQDLLLQWIATLQGILSWPLTWFWLQGQAGESKVFKRSDVTFVLGPSLTTKQKLFKHQGKGGPKTLLLEAARKDSSRVFRGKQEMHIVTALSKLQVSFLWCSLWIKIN